jgi:multicomponent Na+:H+ antiporter subunit E
MGAKLLLAVPMALVWMPLTGQVNLGGFLVGMLLGVAILQVILPELSSSAIHWSRVPDQCLAASVYLLTLFRDIWISAFDVAGRVIQRKIPMKPGIIETVTQVQGLDPHQAEIIAAVSAHGITITPGELVVDFDGSERMYVHCLDIDASLRVADSNQARRIALLRRIFP